MVKDLLLLSGIIILKCMPNSSDKTNEINLDGAPRRNG